MGQILQTTLADVLCSYDNHPQRYHPTPRAAWFPTSTLAPRGHIATASSTFMQLTTKSTIQCSNLQEKPWQCSTRLPIARIMEQCDPGKKNNYFRHCSIEPTLSGLCETRSITSRCSEGIRLVPPQGLRQANLGPSIPKAGSVDHGDAVETFL